MRREKSYWMIKPKSFIKLIGADYELMRNAGGSVLMRFYISSFIICVIALVAFISVRYAIELLFHVTAVEIFFSLFLSLLFLLMYVFLINTFAKDVRHRNVFNLSNAVRTCFVVFMGFILSKPLEILIYKNKLDEDVARYRQELHIAHGAKISNLFQNDIVNLTREVKKYEGLNTQGAFDIDIKVLHLRMDSIAAKQQKLTESSWEKIKNGAYFIYRVQTVMKRYPLSWILCVCIIFLFVLPGYIVYSISKAEAYFEMKKNMEAKIIRIAYANFSLKYSRLFKEKYGLEVNFFSNYEDPPFNTKLRQESSFRSSDDFHKKYSSR